MQMDEIKKQDPGGALKGNAELKMLQDQLEAMNQSLDRLTEYSAKDVEKSLTTARGLIKDLQGAPYEERGAKAAAALKLFQKVTSVAGKGIKKLA